MSIYCSTDWHGCYWVWEKVKEILKPNDRLIFLGDAADRGPDGWRLIKELLDDQRVIYIKGNHEDMMEKALQDWLKYPDDFYWNQELELWFYNGAEPTYNSFIKDNIPIEEKRKYLYQLADLPCVVMYHNTLDIDIYLIHAGCDGAEYVKQLDNKDFLWDRTHYIIADAWHGQDEVIIHGHTPIPYLREEQLNVHITDVIVPQYNGGVYWYGQGHKACIDMGTVFTGNAVLLDLDTFEEILIKGEAYV